MEEADSQRKQKRIRNRLCPACSVISKVQCKDHNRGTNEDVEYHTIDGDKHMRKCQSCQQMYDERDGDEEYDDLLPTPPTTTTCRHHDFELDCYPYTFSPLLLFAQAQYFDKGYSNYNSVAQFFAPILPDVNMLENVLYERKNMLYEELFDFVTTNKMLVTCCIDAHFTAFQVLADRSLIYYDPLSSNVLHASGDNYDLVVGFLLLKCNYGDNTHLQDHKDYYTGKESNATRKMLYQLWQKVNMLEMANLRVRWSHVSLNLDRYVLINSRRDLRMMSTQLTGNTCYFQVYLFAILCKTGAPTLSRNSSLVEFQSIDKLEATTICLSRFLLEFFVQVDQKTGSKVLRPLTNSNVVLDFYRYTDAPYFAAMTRYLADLPVDVPDYELQYHDLLRYFTSTKTLHTYSKFTLTGAMSSALNTKSLQAVYGTDDAVYKLARSNYYKYRAANLMFGFNSGIMSGLSSFCEFNALRKNQLLAFYQQLHPIITDCRTAMATNKYRDYYFIPQFEVGQQELVDVHHYTYLIDICSLLSTSSGEAGQIVVERVNQELVDHIYFSTQKRTDYDKMMSTKTFRANQKHMSYFLGTFFSIEYLQQFVGLGFAEINPKEKEVNSLTQTVFYSSELMGMQSYRMEYEFEKECINQMARSTLRKYERRLEGRQSLKQKYRVSLKIGHGFTYTKYNTLMHFLNVVECYWQNPDLNNIQVFGKDIRALLAVSCQKVFFEEGHTYYHYGPMELSSYTGDVMDLSVATSLGVILPGVSRDRKEANHVVLTDRVYEYTYLRNVLVGMFERVKGNRMKTDNAVLNLCLLSIMLDFGLYEEYAELLNLPFLQQLTNLKNKRQLQVEVANLVHEFDRKNSTDSVTRLKLEELLFETSYKFLVNKGFPARSKQNELIQELNADPAYQQQLLLCKVNMSLCQINKSVEVDYYKVRCNGEFRTIIPQNFSKMTGEYLEQITKRYTFSERGGVFVYDDLPLFDLREMQPEINLYRVRFDSASEIHSMVKYIEIKNSFHALGQDEQYLVFIADNTLLLEVSSTGAVTIRINKIAVEVATIFFNTAISFVPCFKYADSEDVILFASPNIHYLVDQGGQFCTDYYGMKHELIECIYSDEVFVDLNDEHVFKKFKLQELLTESKTVICFPDYLLQVPGRQPLINLLDMAIYVRNLSFFIIVLFYLRRASVSLEFVPKEEKITKITGPWKEAILYVLNKCPNAHYEAIFEKQFFDLNQHQELPLRSFIDVLCENFTRYQRVTEDGEYQIIPTEKQKMFLQRIITAEECFHFSEVGSGKTKVILPLLCQAFLSNNKETHQHLARGGKVKDVLVVLVPEHLVPDARAQVYRYCLNLNFREEYRVYDDIFALLHDNVHLGNVQPNVSSRFSLSRDKTPKSTRPYMKQIFVTSFNQFKRALTYDTICAKVWPHREHMLIVADEVDDFLDRDKLVFNICSNKGNAFDRPTLELYFEVSRAAYRGECCAEDLIDASANPAYWRHLREKLGAIHAEIQDASRSVNKSFGIFNEQSLRHCSTNIAHDVEGYKSLIARPYESVNRAMPGSFYSDVERTIYLTYVILVEDIGKYDELFQEERKFISFEYWSAHVNQLDYDDLVYGNDRLSELVSKHPGTRDGLIRFLYGIILRRMEIRDKSRSVNSIDIVFNFDCIGFTGTPFIDNYPTFAYIRQHRQDDIPTLIDRSFYAYTSDDLSQEEFEERFARFQGQNSRVLLEYVSSDFMHSIATDELAILEQIFTREDSAALLPKQHVGFNAIVDLCGIFKRSSIHDIRDLVLRHFGPDRFHYVYHIDQTDSNDRVLRVNSDNDVQFDEEFYKHLCKTYGAGLREKVFFFVDNRNVIGKDIPFQLLYHHHFGQPLFAKSVVLAHDVDDFSKIWQAMGRSRTMNDTMYSIYKSGISTEDHEKGMHDIKEQALSRQLYIRNCDQKMAGNISSIYQTLVSLHNLSQEKFYYCDEIVNCFLEKMNMTISSKLDRHQEQLSRCILDTSVSARILTHILADKFKRSTLRSVSFAHLTQPVVRTLLHHIVQQKFEQREASGDVHDDFIRFLSGEQQGLLEISYTKQQQKQKQKQQNKAQDSDTMDVFDKKNQLLLTFEMDNYFEYTLHPETDLPKILLMLPVPVPILTLTYTQEGTQHVVNVYPTLQFLYSHHIQASYITQQIREEFRSFTDANAFCARFIEAAQLAQQMHYDESPDTTDSSGFEVGQMVLIHDMEKKPEFNGLRGLIVCPGASHGRWGVSLHIGGVSAKPVSFKEANLEKVSPTENDLSSTDAVQQLQLHVRLNQIRQNPHYTLAAVQRGVYVIGMKDQFNTHDMQLHPLQDQVQYVADDMGFVLYDKSDNAAEGCGSVDTFGPYFIEQYILMEVLSKQEVAQNVLDYYVHHREKLQRSLAGYNEKQGKGFVCWRFLINEDLKTEDNSSHETEE